jgi:twinkle protein
MVLTMDTFADHGIEIPQGKSGEIRTTCPQCSPTRRKNNEKCLAVNIDKRTWFCHHCGHSGGLKVSNKKHTAQNRFSHPPLRMPTYQAPTVLPKVVSEWFESRCIPREILEANRIGWGPSFGKKPAIRFPYFKDGAVVNIKHRTLDKEHRQEKDAEKCFYRFDAAMAAAEAGEDTLYITEGEIDALTLQTAGFNAVVSVPDGAPSPGAKEYRTKFSFLKSAEDLLSRFNRVILVVDSDEPGKCLERELARRISPEKCWRVTYPPDAKDANEVFAQYGAEGVECLIETARPYPVDGLYLANDYRDEVSELYHRGPNNGLGTGWAAADKLYTVRPGELSIVTGIPGSGKSNFLDALAINMAQLHGWGFAVFSPENWPVERHIQQLIEKRVNKPFRQRGQFENRMTSHDMEKGLEFIDEHFYFIVPREEILSVDAVLEKARIAIFRHGVQGVVIDPWNEIEHYFESLTETQYISKQLSKIRRFARTNAVHIWVVAHPRNLLKGSDGQYRPPTPYEISGGANWRNKADICLCIHRPDFMHGDETEVIVQKVRFREVGSLGKVSLNFCKDTGRYFEERLGDNKNRSP